MRLLKGVFNERPEGAIEPLIIHRARNLLLALVGPDLTRPPALTRTWCLYELLVALLVRGCFFSVLCLCCACCML